MLINLRNALMAGKRLPYDAEVEYLESTGTQWIDTGVKITSNIRIEMQAAMTSNNCWLFGGRTAYHNAAIGIYRTFTGTFRANYAATDYETNGDTLVHVFEQNKNTFYLDGTLVRTFVANTFLSQSPIYLFNLSINEQGTPSNIGLVGRGYACKIWDNGVLVRDYIPVRKGTVGYLYDRVSGKLFGNAGTGDFVVGPDVVPVEYLGFNNSQYIDTGLTVKSTLRITCDVRIDDVCRVFGGRTASGENQFDLFQYETANTRAAYGNQIVNITGVGTGRHLIDFNQNVFSVDGVVKQTFTARTFSAPSPIYIGALSIDNSGTVSTSKLIGRLYSTDIYDGDPVRKFSPVRVGSGSTWEGAMMDTLTRRIYRNAGTGAFGYGADLPLETLAN